MAKVTLVFSESAVGDLEAIRDWYVEQQVPEVGRRLVAEIFKRAEALQNHPNMGRIVSEFGQEHLRELIQPPFRIVYRHDRRTVRIVRVWRSERLLKLSDDREG